VTPTAAGTYTYTYAVTNGAYGAASCSQTVVVKRAAPTFTCPSSARATIGETNNVSLSLSGVTGCDEGGDYCYYSISGDGNISVSGNSYTGGDLPAFTDGNVTTDGTEKTYTVRLTNSVGSTEQTCRVEFAEGSSGGCNCTCPTGCDNLNKTGGSSANTGVCYFVTAFDIGAWNGTNVNVNGNTFSNTQKTQNDYSSIDGGYYIQFTSSNWPSVSMTGGTPVCGGGTSSSSAAASSSGSGGGSIAVGSSGVSITAGTHLVTCSGGGQLICWRSGDEFTFTLEGNDCKAYAGEGWGSCGGGTCKSTAQTIVSSKDMYCKGGW